MKEATDWKMVIPMVLASPAYQVGKVGALRFLLNAPARNTLTHSLSLAAVPVAAGFGLETTFFSLASRSLTHFFAVPVAWDLGSIAHDWASAGMTLGFLKGTGYLGRQGMMGFRGLHQKPVQTWGAGDHRALWWSAQASGYLGLVGSHQLETMVGLRLPEPGGNLWLDALGTHLALGLGSHGGRQILGSRLVALEQQLGAQADRLSRQTQGGFGAFGFPPGWVTAGAASAGATMTVSARESNPLQNNIFMAESRGGSEPGDTIPPVSSTVPPVLLPLTTSFPPSGEVHRNGVLKGKYVLIGNRGEPAVRAIHTIKEMGGRPIVYVSDADQESLHANLDGVIPLRLKGRTSNETYNNIDARMGALKALMSSMGIQAQEVIAWEGWGFRSEDPELFARYEEMGVGIAGAPSASHRLMGDKVSARRVAKEAGVPIVEGSQEIGSFEAGLEFSRGIGFPVIIKGQATGGGSAIKEVHREEDFRSQYEAAIREAASTSGKPAVFIEKFIPSMRHLEVQVIADGKGSVVIVDERDCTVQRKSKKQKIVEESVSNFLRPDIKSRAVDIAAKIMGHPEMKEYKGPGTIEIIWDTQTDQLYFMEMNTRLQVEHTVSEMVTGKNLLKAQLELGAGEGLSFQSVAPKGHSIEVRITAEDPFDNFKPSTGRILYYREPHAHKTARIRVRVDSGVEVGSVVTADYDPMLAKLIVWGENRAHALEGLRNALEQFEILGPKTNIPFLKKLIASNEFQEGQILNTNWVEETFLKSEGGRPDYKNYPQALLTAAIQTFLKRKNALLASKQEQLMGLVVDPKVKLSFQGQNFETEVYEQAPGRFLIKVGQQWTQVGLSYSGEYLYNLQIDGIQRRALVKAGLGKRDILLDNVNYEIKVAGEGDLGPGAVYSPMPGKVVKVLVQPGDTVKKGDPLVVVEAMKLENSITAEKDGVVREIKVKEDQQVEENNLLVMLALEGAPKGLEEASTVRQGGAEDMGFGNTLLESVKSKTDSETSYAERMEITEQLRSYFKGYDGPISDLLEVVPKLRLANGEARQDSLNFIELQSFVGELMSEYHTVESLFTPVNWAHWVRYRQMGILAHEGFNAQLSNALARHGVRSMEPGPDLEEALFRITQSHNRRREKVAILSQMIPWISEFKFVELLPMMPALSRLYSDGVPKTFYNLINENEWKLQRRISGAQEVTSLERAFEGVLYANATQHDAAVQEFFGVSTEVLPFLVRQALRREDPTICQAAYQLLQRYFYENRYQTNKFSPTRDGQIIELTPHPDVKEKGLVVNFSGMEGEAIDPVNFEKKLVEVMERWRGNEEQGERKAERVLEFLLPKPPTGGDFAPLGEVLNEHIQDGAVRRVTFIVQEDPEFINFHTFERSSDGKAWVENGFLRGVHPSMAQELGLNRWMENFEINRMDHVLPDAPNVHSYDLQAKKDAKDHRQLVIGDHRGRITWERFEGERVENRLINDFRHLKQNPKYALDEDSKIVWSWLPYALKEMGKLPEGFDPFSLGVLTSSPAELIQRFEVTEPLLREVASFYHGKVKRLPEVEQVVQDTAMAVDQIQNQESPTVADIYIRQPVDMCDAEIRLLAFRLAPMFVGKQLERTTVHFKRREGGKINGYIAEIMIPGQTRFEVTIKGAKEDIPPHRVRTALERKQLKQQSRGRQYVYNYVNLVNDVVREEFFSRGNAPADAVQVQEMILEKDGALVPTSREAGQNKLSKVAFEVTVRLPVDVGGEETVTRSFMVIADDYTVKNGSMSREEGRLYKAVVDRAIEKGIPQLYLTESVGAFIGFADQLLPILHHDTERNVLYVNGSDLETPVPGTGAKVNDLLNISEPYGENRFPVTSILGLGPINTESLNGSGMAGEAQSRARAHVPTATIASSTTVGIATYLARLSEFVIMMEGSYLGLTGRNAINNTFGTNYKTESEIAGTEVMADNGVAYKVVHGERDALRAFLRWIDFQPLQMGQEAPRFNLGSQKIEDRDIGPVLQQLIKGRGQSYSTKELDRAVFDPGSVWYVQGDGYWGRRVNVGYATLGGIPVGMASMEMRPKAMPGENEMMLYPGGLDGDSSIKLADHIRQVNRLGLPFIFNASITGFLPRREDHKEKRVVPGGAQILDALREFRQAAVIWVPPQGFLYGGAWVVIDRNINPNVVMVADHTAQLGILGSAAANELPLVTRHHPTPADKKKTRLMLDLQNTPHRALQVGSIHGVIEESGKTPAILYDHLNRKMGEIRSKREEETKQKDLIRQVTGALDLTGWSYTLLPNGEIEIRFPQGSLRTGLEFARSGLQAYFSGTTPNLFQTFMGNKEGSGTD